MGMGTSGIQLVAIFNEDVKKICPKEFASLEGVLLDLEIDFDDFMKEFDECGGPGNISDEDTDRISKVLRRLQKAFAKKYPGLQVSPFYHYEENADRYDDFTGGAWEITGAWQKTQIAKKLDKKLGAGATDFKMITVFG